jgi:hypothetical protein
MEKPTSTGVHTTQKQEKKEHVVGTHSPGEFQVPVLDETGISNGCVTRALPLYVIMGKAELQG